MIINSYNFGTRTPYVDEVLADNPIYYYRLGDSTSTAVDIGSAARNGTYTAGYTLNQNSLLATDTANKAVLLNGSTGYVVVGNFTENQFNTLSSFTMECLVKFNGFAASGSSSWLMGKGFDGGTSKTSYFLSLGVSGATKTMRCGTNDGASVAAAYDASAWTTGTIYHVVGTYTFADTTWRLYIDGTLVASQSGVGAQAGSRTFSIGRNDSSLGASSFLNGTIDEVAVYNTALSSARIAAHYAAAI